MGQLFGQKEEPAPTQHDEAGLEEKIEEKMDEDENPF
jgi:hypothetical protein